MQTRSDIINRLHGLGINPTRQRVSIAMLMLSEHQHLSADQVLARVREQGAHVSKATVYNTLSLFAAKGLLREVIVDPTRVFYDSNTSDHHHIYNVDTGALSDIPAERFDIPELPTLPPDTVAEGVDVIVRVRSA